MRIPKMPIEAAFVDGFEDYIPRDLLLGGGRLVCAHQQRDRDCNVENSSDPFQRREYADLTVKRDNISVTDRGESYQAEVQQPTLTAGDRGFVEEERSRTEDVDRTVNGKPLHPEQQVNTDCGVEVRGQDGA